MDIYFGYRRDNPKLAAATPAELDQILDDFQRESRESGLALMAVVVPVGSPSAALEVGVNSDNGFVAYSSRTPDVAVTSLGSDVEGKVGYDLQNNTSYVPRSCEIPFDRVRAAVHEFMQTGTQPTNIAWQPSRPLEDDA